MRQFCKPMCRVALISVHASPLATTGNADGDGQAIRLAQLARELACAGVAVDVFTRRCEPEQPDLVYLPEGVRVVHVPAGPAQHVSHELLQMHIMAFARWVTSFARRQAASYDLVHATCFTSGIAAAYLKCALGLPFATTFAALGGPPRSIKGENAGSPAERCRSGAFLVQGAGRVIAASPQDRFEIAQLHRIVPAGTAAIEHGFSPSEFWPVPMPEARRRLDIDPAQFVLLHLGHMAPRNGADTAIQGLAMLRQNHGVDAALVVVGGDQRGQRSSPAVATSRRHHDGAELARLRQLARDLGVIQQVRFAGRQPRHALRDYYSAADVFVRTPWYAPAGITPIEAMACARPVVAASVGDIDRAVVDGITGYLLPARDPEALAERLAQLQRQSAPGAGDG